MLTCPESLVARIFKARYFPNTTFYEATLGGNPNYVWRSIMASQDLVRSGYRRRIGNGRMTKVWDHPWLPDSQDPDVGLILQTLVCVEFKDDWFWMGDIRGVYTVKNGYRWLREINAPWDAVWNNIWKLQVPPKWRIFLWRAITNVLPTITNLVKRRVEIPNVCPACGVLEEDVMHILCNCVYARRVWNISQLQIPNFGDHDFMQWVELWLGNSATSAGFLKDQICGILYEIWRARNMAVWDLALPSPLHLCVAFQHTWAAWNLNTTHGRAAALPPLLLAMQHDTLHQAAASLPHDAVLCSTDADFYGSQHAPTFGFYVRSPEGVFVAAVNGPLSCPYDPLLAEAMTIREALSWLQDHNYHNIVILSDCAVLVDSFWDVSSYCSYLGIILDSCLRLFNSFSTYSIKFVRRGTNLVAHALAKHVGAVHARSVWRESLPSFIPSDLS
ncbi:PREDICTED: uncharacterized protein LOC109155343 [Ipomoea nil]|uniref:uncharacterized protein LOC109155343 n=1 Tax=Ipomoea nil TaxID=35883 RepID=UPI000901EF4B|nr:PREDICTED: uncharacterized protein LOC109155343 [Ipomoea nil]